MMQMARLPPAARYGSVQLAPRNTGAFCC